MLTKYYSEVLKRDFDSEKACLEAEDKYNKEHALEIAKKEERAAAAKEVEDLYKKANEAYKEANEALSDFCKKYGSFHTTIKDVPSTGSLFDFFFDNWLF